VNDTIGTLNVSRGHVSVVNNQNPMLNPDGQRFTVSSDNFHCRYKWFRNKPDIA
jgi:hypothetical protein